jgi:hypothetical protein
MDVLNRWRSCADDPLFRTALEASPELHARSRQIFGDVLGTKDLPEWLAHLKNGE